MEALPAQTPVTALGLGYPAPPIDARAAALGGTGLGIAGGSLSARNPADLALFRTPILGITLTPEDASVKAPGATHATGRSRLAVLQAVLPIGRWTFGLGVGGDLDQDWSTIISDTLESSVGKFPFEERREHDGGLSSVNLVVGRRLGPVAVGAAVDALTGSLRQTFRRDFEPDVDDANNVIGFASGEARWSYSSWRLRAGITAQVARSATLAAAISWTDELRAERDTVAEAKPTRRFDMPLALEVGGSAQVSQRFLATAAGGWKGWSDTDVSALQFASADVWWFGVGVEYAARALGMPLPLRIGYRLADLPFYEDGFGQLRETALTFGLGGSLAGGRALFDVALEIGSRGDLGQAGAEESFQRFSISLALIQE